MLEKKAEVTLRRIAAIVQTMPGAESVAHIRGRSATWRRVIHTPRRLLSCLACHIACFAPSTGSEDCCGHGCSCSLADRFTTKSGSLIDRDNHPCQLASARPKATTGARTRSGPGQLGLSPGSLWRSHDLARIQQFVEPSSRFLRAQCFRYNAKPRCNDATAAETVSARLGNGRDQGRAIVLRPRGRSRNESRSNRE